ncbi:hypothetical protein [Carboxylicivirga sp. N1Y90]|uniref:hypothetical protein n=1 Tax=Carboxylicivirga fragile TaxID=3417571 RepID=UPI003D3269E1|nr:hypothetical protein [Marinilabiliaceae bacterium N1Y90]
MELSVKEVVSKKELKTFIRLPAKIHKGHSNWLPNLYTDEWKLFSKDKNASFKHCDTILLIAYRGKKPVGRIMGIVPHKYNVIHKLNTVRFAFMECIDDESVFGELINAIEEWGAERKCDQIIGPMGFSDKDPQGFVIKGFDAPTMMVTNCNYPYMVEYVSQFNYQPHVDLCQYEVPLTTKLITRYKPLAQRVEKYNSITVHEFKSIRSIKPFIPSVFRLINETYKNIYGFSALSDQEVHEFANRYLPLLNPHLIKIITGADGEVVAFVIAMADLSEGIRKSKGYLFPSGWYHILKANRSSKRLVLLLGAISEDRRNKGLDAILGYRLIKSALKSGFTSMDSHLIMRDNYKMRREIERLDNHHLYKEYRIFQKALTSE